ncbi:hypothetical protein HOY34_19220 [Xinfangfangia sp. D13-10-4-6]|uniref:hypothetical protein n=1 Tax=Pseudogemmobacter hezensis TaxID=2737662 RepID=UPI0015520A0A|nr:hypothetical protein [Pseudogemmobacter hezensis]NPD17320.1 hypothetical protein [Pseudogemmobacter hezensis]
MAFSLAAVEESSANWLDHQREAIAALNSARAQMDLAKAKHAAARVKLKAARLANREVQMPVYHPDDQHKLKQLKALLALRDAELKAIRCDAKVRRAVTRHDAARLHWQRVEKGEGFSLAA